MPRIRTKHVPQISSNIHRTQQQLKESEVFYKHLSDITPEAVVVHSEGKIVYINAACAQLIAAKSAEAVIGMPVVNFIHPDSLPLIKKELKIC